MTTNRMTKTSSSRRLEPYTAPPWAQAAGEKLVKVNSAQINTIRQQHQATAARRKKRAARTEHEPAAAKPLGARALRAAELEFRKLAIELGMERARAVVDEVERGTLGSR
jgi:hypothetical protein